MGIDPKIEQPTRKLLGHAIRRELDDLAAQARAEGTEALMGAIPLCLLASAYIAIDVSDRWPTDADLRKIAANASKSATELDISEQEIYEYLSRVALGPEKLDDVFSVEALATIPCPGRHARQRRTGRTYLDYSASSAFWSRSLSK